MFPLIHLLLIDALAVCVSIAGAYFTRGLLLPFFAEYLPRIQPLNVYIKSAPFAILLCWITFYFAGLYKTKKRISAFTEMGSLFLCQCLVVVLIMAGSYLAKYDYSRLMVLFFALMSITLLLLGRTFFRRIERALYKKNIGVTNIAVVGTDLISRHIQRRIMRYEQMGYRFKGFISILENQTLPLFPTEDNTLLGQLSDISAIIRKHRLNELYFSESAHLNKEKIILLALKCRKLRVRFNIASGHFQMISPHVHVDQIEGIPGFEVTTNSFSLYNEIIKRVFDLTISLLLLILLAPIFLLIGTALALEGSGPIIFSQKRVGRFEKVFMMYKFRTLKTSTGPLRVRANDPRVTKTGKILRTFSLDELPQIYNILKGDMSFVGPRPELLAIVKTYKRWHHLRHQVKPGLTGLWQILGRKDLPLTENIEYDLYYIQNLSFILDIIIMLKTIPKVIAGKGAY